MSNDSIAAPVRATKAPARKQKAPGLEAPAAMPAGDDRIVLTLRPEGAEFFTGNNRVLAQEAGFQWLNGQLALGYACRDTGKEVARLVVNGFAEMSGQLKEIQIHITADGAGLYWGSGGDLARAINNYATSMGGYVIDGVGARLDGDAIEAIGEHIDRSTEQRREKDRADRTVTLPNGEVRENSDLSFMYKIVREAGSRKHADRTVHFDAPALGYYEGGKRGMEMAWEVIQHYRQHRIRHLPILDVLAAATRCEDSPNRYREATPGNVAAGFLEIIQVLISVGARQLNPEWLAKRIEQLDREKASHEQRIAEEKAEFVSRMKAAREAKKKGGAA